MISNNDIVCLPMTSWSYDTLFDYHNDYMNMYKNFGNKEYLERAKYTMEIIHKKGELENRVEDGLI